MTEIFRFRGTATYLTNDALEAAVNAWLEKDGLKLKDVAQPARVALTGKTASPGLYEMMEVLGKDVVLARLDRAIARAGG